MNFQKLHDRVGANVSQTSSQKQSIDHRLRYALLYLKKD